MAKNGIQNGDSVNYTVVGSDVVSGQLIVLNDTPGIAVKDAVVGADVELLCEGVFSVPKKAPQAQSQGKNLYYDAVNDEVTTSSNDGGSPLVVFPHVGWVWKAAGSSDTTVEMKLIG